MTAALFTYQVIDAGSRVVPGAKVSFMQGFRKGPVWHDPEMRTPARNPYITDGAGRVALYLKAGETYEITITTPRGDIQQFTHTARADGEVIRETVEVERIVERVVEVPVEVEVESIETAALRVELAKLKDTLAKIKAPPEDIADLFVVHETPAESHKRLMTLYTESKQKAELARGYGGTFDGKSVIDWERKAERYESGLKWNRGRLAESL